MKQQVSWGGKLKSYLEWPIFVIVLLLIMDVAVFACSKQAGLVALIFTCIYLVIVVALFFVYKPSVMKELVSFAAEYGQVQRQMLEEFSIPYGLLDIDGKTVWMNHEMQTLFGKNNRYHQVITTLIPDLCLSQLPHEQETTELETMIHEKNFRIQVRRIHIDEWQSSSDLLIVPDDQSYLYTLYMFDDTELMKYKRLNEEQKLVVGLIYIDNYDDVLDSMDDVRKSLLLALIDRKIDKYISNHQGIMKKLEKDKYFIIIQQRYLNSMQEGRFSLMEDIKTVNVGNEMNITLSIGIGTNGKNYQENYSFAHAAIDLALGRGGDQAVVKDATSITYYGGKSQQVEKSTRVRARVKAQALLEIINAKDDVVIMGHKITDIDTFGAAIGIFRAARSVGKRAYILIDSNSHSITPYLNMFLGNKDYEPDMFINHQMADELVDANTVLVVVDTNRPSNTEYPALLDRAKTIVVLDHHRQSSEIIRNATLSYTEPYASSACEMVAEILQYFNEGVKLTRIEADCVYAGIIVDTNNFLAKTGIRTFEAAAYLRRCGADVTRVRKIMRNDISAYKARAEAIQKAELYHECYAISILPSQNLDMPTIIGAQAANELLNIIGVKASFVLTSYNNIIYFSARSIDEVNVQIIMERLGGGGHMNIAGAQLAGVTAEAAKEKLKETLDAMIAEGAI